MHIRTHIHMHTQFNADMRSARACQHSSFSPPACVSVYVYVENAILFGLGKTTRHEKDELRARCTYFDVLDVDGNTGHERE